VLSGGVILSDLYDGGHEPDAPGVSVLATAAKAASPGPRVTVGTPLRSGNVSSAFVSRAVVVAPAAVIPTTFGHPYIWHGSVLALTNWSQAPTVPAATALSMRVIWSWAVTHAGAAAADVVAAGNEGLAVLPPAAPADAEGVGNAGVALRLDVGSVLAVGDPPPGLLVALQAATTSAKIATVVPTNRAAAGPFTDES
jgi:hypothetical protein